MKKPILTLALFFILATSFAQEWAPVGSKWYYSMGFWGGSPVLDKPLIIESIGDTLINGQPCRIIYGGCECSFFIDTTYMYFDDNKILLYNKPTNSFHPLYDFSAGKGETWTVFTPNTVDSVKVVVDSVYTKEIFGVAYKIQKVRNLNYNDRWFFGGEVAEGIGNITQCFFPSWATCDPWSGWFRCYDNTVVTRHFRNIPCDTVLIYTTARENILNGQIEVYPNPAKTSLFIEFKPSNPVRYSIEVYSISGQKILVRDGLNSGTTEIPLTGFDAGMYFMKIQTSEGQIHVKKFVKE